MRTDTISGLSAKWWTFLVRGILALILAAVAFVAPGATAVSFVFILGAYFIISGIAVFISGFSPTESGRWWSLLILGPLQIVLGLAVLAEPGAGALTLAFLFAIWMIMTGAMEISSAVALRSHLPREFWGVVLGVITLAFGIYVAFNPGLSILALVYTVGLYALFAGVALIGLAFRVKSAGSSILELQRST
jgi:uncharacterized membrane protein HdeD (DUF308 family)